MWFVVVGGWSRVAYLGVLSLFEDTADSTNGELETVFGGSTYGLSLSASSLSLSLCLYIGRVRYRLIWTPKCERRISNWVSNVAFGKLLEWIQPNDVSEKSQTKGRWWVTITEAH